MNNIEKIIGYLSDARPEHKIAGIIALNSIINSQKLDAEAIADVVPMALNMVEPSFVIRMIETEDLNGKSVVVQSAGLNFMVIACNETELAKKFLPFTSGIVKGITSFSNISIKDQCVVALKLLALTTGKRGRDIVLESLLNVVRYETNVDTARVLRLVAEIGIAPIESEKSICIKLSDELALKLRKLTIQGLHGAADHCIRDNSYVCICQMLSGRTDRGEYALSPSWTLGNLHTQSISVGPDSAESAEGDKQIGAFAQLLCSLVRGELQLLCDEALFLCSNTPETVTARFDMHVPPRTFPTSNISEPSPEVRAGAGKDSVAGEGHTTAEAEDPAKLLLLPNPKNDVEYFRSRINRTLSMFCTCLYLLETFLELLIGSPEDGDSECEGVPCWSSLPIDCLLSVKRSLYGTVEDLTVFVKDAAVCLCDVPQLSVAFMTPNQLRAMTCCAVDTLGTYSVQDTELLVSFIKAVVPSALQCGFMNMRVRGEVSLVGAGVDKDCVVAVVSELGAGTRELKGLLLNQAQYDPLEALLSHGKIPLETSELDQVVNANIYCDATLHILEPLRAAVGALLSAASGNPGEQQQSISLDDTGAEHMFDVIPQLLPRLTFTLHLCATNFVTILNESNSRTSTDRDSIDVNHLLEGMVEISRVVADLILTRELKHKGELAMLRVAEGDQAVLDVLGVDMSCYREMLGDLDQVTKIVTSEYARLGKSRADFQQILDSFDHVSTAL